MDIGIYFTWINIQKEKAWILWKVYVYNYLRKCQGFPGGAVVENLPANAGDTGSSPGLGRSYIPRSN